MHDEQCCTQMEAPWTRTGLLETVLGCFWKFSPSFRPLVEQGGGGGCTAVVTASWRKVLGLTPGLTRAATGGS